MGEVVGLELVLGLDDGTLPPYIDSPSALIYEGNALGLALGEVVGLDLVLGLVDGCFPPYIDSPSAFI